MIICILYSGFYSSSNITKRFKKDLSIPQASVFVLGAYICGVLDCLLISSEEWMRIWCCCWCRGACRCFGGCACRPLGGRRCPGGCRCSGGRRCRRFGGLMCFCWCRCRCWCFGGRVSRFFGGCGCGRWSMRSFRCWRGSVCRCARVRWCVSRCVRRSMRWSMRFFGCWRGWRRSWCGRCWPRLCAKRPIEHLTRIILPSNVVDAHHSIGRIDPGDTHRNNATKCRGHLDVYHEVQAIAADKWAPTIESFYSGVWEKGIGVVDIG